MNNEEQKPKKEFNFNEFMFKLNNELIKDLQERLSSPDCPLNQPVDLKTIDIQAYVEALEDKKLLENLLNWNYYDDYIPTENYEPQRRMPSGRYYSERDIMNSFRNGTDELHGFGS